MFERHLSKLNLSLLLLGFCAQGFSGDITTLGGSNSRNMVNLKAKNIPTEWDLGSKENVKWVADLGSQTYGNVVVANGKVLVGTNNGGTRDKQITGDKGNLLCFNEADGSFLWQAVHDKLPGGAAVDWPNQGVASTPSIDGDRVYYVSNQCQLVCLDLNGMGNGNDGITTEQHSGAQHADVIWTYDMMKELKVFPHNLANSSPLVEGDLVYLNTGNGVDESHKKIPSPDAPDFIAVHKKTGKLVWQKKAESPILHGQWSSPASGMVKGKLQIFFAGGDGWIYSLDPKTGDLIWKFDCNPKGSEWKPGGYGEKNNIIATPVFFQDSVYIGVGQDPEHGSGPGHLYRIDATGTGDVTATAAKWHYGGDDFGRTLSTVSVADGLLYVSELDGIFHCVDIETGKALWKHDLFAAVWGSSLVVDGKIYIGDEDGDICILGQGRTKKEINEINVDSAIYTSPAVANGTLFIPANNKLIAISAK